MFAVYSCLVNDHDLRLVGLAFVICTLASFTAIGLLHHVRKSTGHFRYLWLAVSAISTGFGIWATHFVAMLAYAPQQPNGYDIALTALSLVAVVGLTGMGLAVAALNGTPGTTWIGGVIVGFGIATMHFTGMAAFRVEGWIAWDPTLVAASIILGSLIGAVALVVGLRLAKLRTKVYGALLLTLAIFSLHFTAMGAVVIVPDPTIAIPRSAVPESWVAIAVSLASFAIVLLGFAGVALDIHDRRRTALEADRMRSLANAAVEGLLVCDGETVVAANESFTALNGSSAATIVGKTLAAVFSDPAAHAKLVGKRGEPVETELLQRDGGAIPVELILRPINFVGKPHHAVAVRDLRARREAEQHIRFLAHHDALTGLPNRASFNRRLDQAVETAVSLGQRLAVLCLDLDGFKEVNDLFGHAAGDSLLQAVAARVTCVLEGKHMLARLGGDEFAVIMSDLPDPAAAGRMAGRIIDVLAADNDDGVHSAYVSASVGIALCPDDGRDRQTLLSHADAALYHAKTEGRGTYRFFEPAMGVQARDRRQIDRELRHAIARRELRLVYQPQMDIRAHKVTGFEALLRWQRASRQIPPSVFVPIAEESGAILPIGEWVLRAACREAASWNQPLRIGVNVSAVQLHSTGFVRSVHEALLNTGLSPRRLELEVTETALTRDTTRALTTLRQLKTLGVRIAMDDFGTGFSSLSNLRAFPFDRIKIGRSFIKSVDTNEQAAAIVRAVLGLGRGFGVPVLAQGVETPDELAFLMDELCSEAQGYHLGRPGPIEQFRGITHGEGVQPSHASELTPGILAAT